MEKDDFILYSFMVYGVRDLLEEEKVYASKTSVALQGYLFHQKENRSRLGEIEKNDPNFFSGTIGHSKEFSLPQPIFAHCFKGYPESGNHPDFLQSRLTFVNKNYTHCSLS